MFHSKEIELFKSIFRGRSDIYARRWEKDGRSGYSPAYEFDWTEFMTHKRRGGSLKDFSNKRLMPLTDVVIKKHLIGQEIIGLYPILPDNTTYFLAADFDGANWKSESLSFVDACIQSGLNPYLERSRSGNGGHIWIFFSEAIPCYRSRQIGLELIRRTFKISDFDKEMSFDRLFPNQDTISQNGFGNLIALPLQGRSKTTGNSLFLDLKTGQPFDDQWFFLSGVKRHSASELESVRQKLIVQPSSNFSPHKAEGAVTLYISGKIKLHRSQIDSRLMVFLKEELNFLNNEFLTKRLFGKSTYKMEKYFKLIEEAGDFVLIPRGFLQQLIRFMEKEEIKYSLQYEYPVIDEVLFTSFIKLTPNQEYIIDVVLKNDSGTIVAPPGSGKTVIGLEIIARRKLPALILVHRKQLMDQWLERIQSFLDIPKMHIGRFSGVKKKCGDRITIGLLQSFARKSDFEELKDRFGTIIVDECHHIPAATFRKVISVFNPRYIYGLTATPERKHNDEKLIFFYTGDIIARLEKQDVFPLPQAPLQVEVFIKSTNLIVPFKFKTDLFQLLSKVICYDTTRNRLIVEDILTQKTIGRKVLVLSERKEHLEMLNLYIKGICETILITGDDSTAARKSKIRQIEVGNYEIILSTGQFFGEGMDVRGINCLILAFPFSFEGKLIQYIGRMRDVGDQRIIIDYRDINIPFLDRQFKKRERFYKKTMTIRSTKELIQ